MRSLFKKSAFLLCSAVAFCAATKAHADDVKHKMSLGFVGGYQYISSKDKNKVTFLNGDHAARIQSFLDNKALAANKKNAHGAKLGLAFLYDFIFESLSVGLGIEAGHAFGCATNKEVDGDNVSKDVLKPGFYGTATVRLGLPNETYQLGCTPYVRFGIAVAQFKTQYTQNDDILDATHHHHKKATKWKVGPTAGLGVSKDFGPCSVQLGYDLAYYGKLDNEYTLESGGHEAKLSLKKERLMTHTVSLGVMIPL